MSTQSRINATAPLEQGAIPLNVPVESGKQILSYWIVTALGLGVIAVVGAFLPNFSVRPN